MKIFLIGMMGVGKTTIGKSLAKYLGINFFDLDCLIEEMYGKSIERLFSLYGEEGFRRRERMALVKVVQMDDSAVISTGGGTPCFYNNMELMRRYGCVIWLDGAPQSIFRRIKKARPLLKQSEDPYSTFLRLYHDRKHFYSQAQFYYKVPPHPKKELEKIIKELEAIISTYSHEK